MSQNTPEKIEFFLTQHSGIIGQQTCSHLLNQTIKEKALQTPLPSFFTPYHSFSGFSLKAGYILSGPLFATLIALKAYSTAIILFIKAIGYDLIFKGWSVFKETLNDIKTCLIGGALGLIYVALAPLINLIDFLGSGIKMIIDQLSEDEVRASVSPTTSETALIPLETITIQEEIIAIENPEPRVDF